MPRRLDFVVNGRKTTASLKCAGADVAVTNLTTNNLDTFHYQSFTTPRPNPVALLEGLLRNRISAFREHSIMVLSCTPERERLSGESARLLVRCSGRRQDRYLAHLMRCVVAKTPASNHANAVSVNDPPSGGR